MAELKPFKGLRYTQKAGEITTLVCPPYDIISEEERLEIIHRNPHNAINLEYNKDGDNIYKRSAENLNNWMNDGILKRDDKPAFYIYEEDFIAHETPYKIKGIIGLLRLAKFSEKIVLPHEETLSKAKEDRLNLMRATGCNFSSIYMMYHDKENHIFSYIEELSSGTPDQSFVTDDGIRHNLWFITDETATQKLSSGFSEKQLYIADGHHRYSTMVNYRDELADKGIITGENHPANFGMVTLMNIENPGLVVFPTHRLVKDVEDFNIEKILEGCRDYFTVTKLPLPQAKTGLEELKVGGKTGFVLYHGSGAYLLELTDSNIMKELLPEESEAYRQLDVAILHILLLERLLGIDKENLANQKNLEYIRDADDVAKAVDEGKGNCGFLINSTGVSEIADVSDAGGKMPQKSTYFYPKLITGHVMNYIMEVK